MKFLSVYSETRIKDHGIRSPGEDEKILEKFSFHPESFQVLFFFLLLFV